MFKNFWKQIFDICPLPFFRWEKKCFLDMQNQGSNTRTPSGDGSLLKPQVCPSSMQTTPPWSLSRMSLLETLNHKDNHCQNPSLSRDSQPWYKEIKWAFQNSWVSRTAFVFTPSPLCTPKPMSHQRPHWVGSKVVWLHLPASANWIT